MSPASTVYDLPGTCPVEPPTPAVPEQQPRRKMFGVWLNRSRRVLLTLALVWVVSIFDLGFTLAQWGRSEFIELNPLAAGLLNGPTHVVAAFKFSLLGTGTIILLLLRRHSVAELACWFLLAAKTYVAVRWYVYFDCVIQGVGSPLLGVD